MQVVGLGYLGLTASDLDEWRSYASDALGLAVWPKSEDPDTLYLRMDEREWRLAVHRGPSSGELAYIGWELASQHDWESGVQELRDLGYDVDVFGDDDAHQRSVSGLARFVAPGGQTTELFYGAVVQPNFVSPLGVRFVTGRMGMGHVVLTLPDNVLGEALRFYQDALGFRVSDYLDAVPIKGALLHCNPRHHSLGLVGLGDGPSTHHFMLEVDAIDDVGRGLDRCNARNTPMMLALGRHANDNAFSFYMISPSGVGVEYGAEGRVIDPDKFSASRLVGNSEADVWGHQLLLTGG
jgi:2,3-dihydroxybiphenyl 1,2-dioxygenase